MATPFSAFFLVKERQTVRRTVVGTRAESSSLTAVSEISYLVRSARDVNNRTASRSLENSPADCFAMRVTTAEPYCALQERASPYPVVTSASSIRLQKGGLTYKDGFMFRGLSGRPQTPRVHRYNNITLPASLYQQVRTPRNRPRGQPVPLSLQP